LLLAPQAWALYRDKMEYGNQPPGIDAEVSPPTGTSSLAHLLSHLYQMLQRPGPALGPLLTHSSAYNGAVDAAANAAARTLEQARSSKTTLDANALIKPAPPASTSRGGREATIREREDRCPIARVLARRAFICVLCVLNIARRCRALSTSKSSLISE
jgi:hypothetical protein